MRIIGRNTYDLKPGLAQALSFARQLDQEWLPRVRRWREIQQRAMLGHLAGDLLLGLAVLVGLSLACGSCNLILPNAEQPYMWLIPLIQIILSISLALAGILLKRQAKKRSGGISPYKKIPDPPDLVSLWWAEVEAEARRIDARLALDPKHGDKGELLLMETLKQGLPNTFFGVRGWKGVPGLDSDVLVFGPNGIWILESKYWSGEVIFDGKGWRQQRPAEEKQQKDIDRQWLNERKILNTILNREIRGWNYELKGGLVFTHPDGILKIDRTKPRPVIVDRTAGWVSKICAAPPASEMSEDALLMALDLILTDSHPLFDDPICRSVYIAQQLYAHEVRKLIEWRRGH
jgi:hypothetical protein